MIAAVMLVKDEADIVGWTVQHLLDQGIDRVYVADNGSTDGTRELLDRLADATGHVEVSDDPEPAYWQADKTTALARRAYDDGATWIVPCDADEIWTARNTGTVGELLRRQGPDVQIVRARLLNHTPTSGDDPDILNPVKRIGHRFEQIGAMEKVAARAAADLCISMGNHAAHYTDDPYVLTIEGLAIHHFPWRSRDQYVRKIRNGAAAINATEMDESICAHWRMFDGAEDEAIAAHFDKWFHDPADPIVYDPA